MVGGVETYSRDLCLLAQEKGYHVSIFRFDPNESDASVQFDGIDFHVVHNNKRSNQALFEKIYKKKNSPGSLFVIVSDQMDIKSKASNVIVIQHGVAFDCPINTGFWSKTRFLQHLNKFLRCIKNVMRFYGSRNTVGVDYNYFNWFRTLGMIYPGKKFMVIPNYASGHISESAFLKKLQDRERRGSLRIVFARRFCDYRGTLLFANCVDRLLKEYDHVDFTFAGNGELKETLMKRFLGNPRVVITSFSAAESIDFHAAFDVAVVPTIFSEGTSLSLLEAMSAGCFPIATHVGGMTNIILDHYNGLLCFPEENAVYNALQETIRMKTEEFNHISENAYHSALESFTIARWKERWSSFMDEVMSTC